MKKRREKIEQQAQENAKDHWGEAGVELDLLRDQDVADAGGSSNEGYETSEDFHDVLDRVICPIKPDDDANHAADA